MAKRAEGAIGMRGRMRRQGPLDRFDESVGEDERIAEGSFNMDPGMRAADEFTDVASAGYRENAKRVAERGGDKQYATSVEEEEADTEADERRKQLMFVLAALIGGGAGGMGASRAMGPGARPGLGVGARNPSQAEWNTMLQQRATKNLGDPTSGMRDLLSSGRYLKPDPWARPQPNISGIDMSRLMKPKYTPQGGMAIDAVSPYLAYRAIKGRGK